MPSKRNESPLVLHVRGVTGFGGGPEKTILNSPRFLKRKGYRSVCAYLHPPGDPGFEQLRQRAVETKADLFPIADRGPLDFRVLRQLIRFCRRERVAIWHAHDYKSNCLGLIVNRFWPMKLVTTVHGWVQHTRRTPLYYAIDRRCLPRYDEVICVSDDLHEAALSYGVSPQRCHWIQNAIDVEEFRVSENRNGCTSPTDVPLSLGGLGRLSKEKGFDLLVKAVAELNLEGVACNLKIGGDGELRNSLQRQIEELNCRSHVALVGQVSNVKAFYESLDLFVLSSLREGLPNVLLEAMALEVPVVSTRVAGIPRLIESGKNGLLVDAGSINELKNGIRAVALMQDRGRRLAVAARETIEQSFSFQYRMERIAEIYDRLLACEKHCAPIDQRTRCEAVNTR